MRENATVTDLEPDGHEPAPDHGSHFRQEGERWHAGCQILQSKSQGSAFGHFKYTQKIKAHTLVTVTPLTQATTVQKYCFQIIK